MTELRRRLADARGGRVVFLSHCLLNQNVRYLGGATRPGGVPRVVDAYLAAGVGVEQLPCPEQQAWGGVLKRRALLAYGAGGTWRAPLVRAAFPLFVAHTRWVYRRLAGRVAQEAVDFRDSGVDVVAVVGIAGSPSCGVRTTLDLRGTVDDLCRCPLAALDRDTVTGVVRAHREQGRGIFMSALLGRFARRGLADVPFLEHELEDGG